MLNNINSLPLSDRFPVEQAHTLGGQTASCSDEKVGTLSSQDEFLDDDERRRVRSGSRTSSKAGKTNV